MDGTAGSFLERPLTGTSSLIYPPAPAVDYDVEGWSPEKKVELENELFKVYDDWRWRMDHLYRIVNEKGIDIPFKMNVAQTLLFLQLWYCNLVLKSRQHGITTWACVFFLDYCLFNSNVAAAIIAHNKDDAQEFFARNIKHAYDSLPAVVRRKVTATRDSARALSFSNGSSIRVTTSGRSGTFQLVHVSELGKISAKYPEKAREIRTGTLNAIHAGNIVIIESTAEGREGDFFDLCDQAQKLKAAGTPLTMLDFEFFFFPWYRNKLNVLTEEDTEKVVLLDYQLKYFEELRLKHDIRLTDRQKCWYVKKWNVQGDDMRREHPSTPEEAFEAAIIGTYFAHEFELIRQQGRITKVPFQPAAMVDTWWDLGMGDSMCIWFSQDIGREIHIIDYYEAADAGFEHYARHLDDLMREKGYRYRHHGAPHDIMVRELFLGGKTRFAAAKAMGIQFKIAPQLSVQSGIEQMRQILQICWFDEAKCTKVFGKTKVGLPSLEHYRKEWNEKLASYMKTPLHNWASHGADAFRTMATLHEFRNAAVDWAAQHGGQAKTGRNIDKKDPGGWT